MKTFIRYRHTGTGAEYEIPVMAIVNHRIGSIIKDIVPKDNAPPAEVQKFIDGPLKQAQQDTVSLFSNSEDLRVYAEGIPWNEISVFAKMTKFSTGINDIAEDMEWMGAVDEETPVQDLEDDQVAGEVPINFFLSLMAKSNNLISATQMLDNEGNPSAVIFVVRGNKDVIEAFMGVNQQLASQIKQHPEGKPPRKPYNH